MKKDNVEIAQVKYRINKISVLEFYINSNDDFKSENDEYKVNFNVNITTEETEKLIYINLKFEYFHPKSDNLVLAITTQTSFLVENYIEAFKVEKSKSGINTSHIPDNFLALMLNISYGTSRGIVLTKAAGTIYEHSYIPPIMISDMLDRIKNTKPTRKD